MKALKNFIIALSVATIIPSYGLAQTDISNEQPYIEVSGTAEKSVVPDEIYIEIILYDIYVHNSRNKITVDEQEEKLKEALKAQGINLTYLYLADLTSDYVKVHWKKLEFVSKRNFTLKVKDAVEVGKVFQELDRLDVHDARISKVSHSKMDSLRREVRIVAIKAAKEKADYMLAAIGEQTGKPLIVKESEPAYYNNNIESNVYIRNSNVFSGTSSAVDIKTKPEEDTDIQFKKIRIASTAYVKFSIK